MVRNFLPPPPDAYSQPCSTATGCQDHRHGYLPVALNHDPSLTAGWLYEDGGEGGRR